MSTKQNSGGAGRVSVTNLDYYTIIKDLLHNFWVVILAGAIAFMAVNIVLQIIYTPLYTSTATLMVTGSANNYNSFATYASDAERFSGILTDQFVLQEVADSLDLIDLEADVEASVIAETNLLSLTVTAKSPQRAFDVAKGILSHYSDISSLMYPNYSLMELVPVSYPSGSSNSIEATSFTKKCVIGAMIGMALIIAICSCFYDNIKNYKDAEEKLDTSVFGVIYHEKKEKKKRKLFKKREKTSILVTNPLVSSAFVEGYKHMRERLISHTRRSGMNVILVTSMLENEGKSTVSANLALSLAAVSDKVLLIDGDLRKPAIHKIFSIDNEKFVNFSQYLTGAASLSDCLYHSDNRNLNLLMEAKGLKKSTEIIDTPPMEKLIEQMREEMDYIIIDTPPLAQVSDAEAIARFADYSIMVLAPDNSKTDLINDCIGDMEACHATLLGCVLNNVNTVSRWIYQHFHINVSRFVSTNTNDYSYGYAASYGFADYYGENGKRADKRSRKGADVQNRDTESADSFFAAYDPERVAHADQSEPEKKAEASESYDTVEQLITLEREITVEQDGEEAQDE